MLDSIWDWIAWLSFAKEDTAAWAAYELWVSDGVLRGSSEMDTLLLLDFV